MSDLLVPFIKEALQAGKSRAEIRQVLIEAGWSEGQVNDSLSRFSEVPFSIAVPRPHSFTTPKLFTLNLFFFVVLYLTIYNFVGVFFTYLDYTLPDGLGQMKGMFRSYNKSIADEIRSYLPYLITGLPILWFTNRKINKTIKETKNRIPKIRLILIYLTILIGSFFVLGSIYYLIDYLLKGELGIRFMIKFVFLMITVFGLLKYFYPEVKEYEQNT